MYHDAFWRIRHGVFDALSLGVASLDCFAPLVDACGDFVESWSTFLCSIVSAEDGSGLAETSLPRKCKNATKNVSRQAYSRQTIIG